MLAGSAPEYCTTICAPRFYAWCKVLGGGERDRGLVGRGLGRAGAQEPHPPPHGQNFLNFYSVFVNFGRNEASRPHRKILDPQRVGVRLSLTWGSTAWERNSIDTKPVVDSFCRHNLISARQINNNASRNKPTFKYFIYRAKKPN